MSTFGGVMAEFPGVRVDYFRHIPNHRPPLASFLSHVHSDHLAGLEHYKSPFIYCSQATRELLLRLERYPHRLNFSLGIIESKKQQYNHLKSLLKPIPLETPTRIELEPGNEIQVTLFGSNHCTGAVMFLFEGNDKAVLYTGDIRSEPWFINSLARNPLLIEYTTGLQTLDCIYLDTTNLDEIALPTKAEGLKELLHKVSKYPKDATFHFSAWTFGYEEVWMALSKAIKSQIHVDQYKMNLYQSARGGSLCGTFLAPEGPALTGYTCGNAPQMGCLTTDSSARIHSCEKGMSCHAINDKTIRIKPIVGRPQNSVGIAGTGAGEGGDLVLQPELELELDNDTLLDQFLTLFEGTEDRVIADIKDMFLAGIRSKNRAISLSDIGLDTQECEVSPVDLAGVIIKSMMNKRNVGQGEALSGKREIEGLPRVITFPYSRHSSYPELCALVKLFRPMDVYPCTVNEDNWNDGMSIRSLFGRECSASIFRHDGEMQKLRVGKATIFKSRQPYSPESRHSSLSTDDSTSASLGSHCQRLRRKAISDGLTERRTKRPRLQFSGSMSSQLEQGFATAMELQNNITAYPDGQLELDCVNSCIGPTRSLYATVSSSTPGCNGDSADISSRPLDEVVSSVAQRDDGGEIISEPTAFDWNQDCMSNDTFFDLADEVVRCMMCGHELWSSAIGFCTGCERGKRGIPYFEILEPESLTSPRLELNGALKGSSTEEDYYRKCFFEPYLDCQSSAYDSQDGDPGFEESYEDDSFIDDDLETATKDDGGSSSSGGTTGNEEYIMLGSAHQKLASDHLRLDQQHAHLASKFSELQQLDHSNVVDMAVSQSALTKAILSRPREIRQDFQMSKDRTEKGDQADGGVDWGEITLVSTQNNHTSAEVEL